MRIKWDFRNEPSENFNEFPSFKVKSTWKPQVEKEFFKMIDRPIKYSSLTNVTIILVILLVV